LSVAAAVVMSVKIPATDHIESDES
jgi:hypothetical protein